MPDQNDLARARVTAILAQADALDDQAVRRAIVLLDELRRQVIAEFASRMSDYDRGLTEAILREVDRLAFEFRTRYAREVAAIQARAFDLGALLVDAPLVQVSTSYFGTYIDRSLLEVSQAYVADLIRGLAADVRDAVSSEVRLGVLAGRPPFEVMQRIGSRIDKGRFASVAQRAEVITRTEVNRVLNMATTARIEQAHRRVPQLRQQWIATLDDRTRATHRAAHEQIRDIGQPFEVGGAELRFPGDPAGPPEETINCRCRAVPYAASWTDVIDPLASTHSVPAWVHERLVAAEVGE